MTPFQEHAARWDAGCGAAICNRACRRVLARGRVPCDVLFVGEAPGVSEDALGVPFVGPAGKLLDRIIARALPQGVGYALTNLVGCLPRDEDSSGKASEPSPEDVGACSRRLVEFIALCRPRLIVCVGALSRDYLDPKMLGSVWHTSRLDPAAPARGRRALRTLEETRPPEAKTPQCHVKHPAAILRAKVVQQGLDVQRCVVTIQNAWEEVNADG